MKRKRTIKTSGPLLRIKGLQFSFPNGTNVLKGIDLVVKPGEIVALLGENGAGKTTLLKHMIGLLEPDKGSIRFRGETINETSMAKVRMSIGFVFQNPDDQLFNPTVGEDVAFGPLNMGLGEREVKKRVKKALRTVDLLDMMDRSPYELSFGEKKRACLAGILAMDTDLLVLDEPTANLDPRSRREVVALLRHLNKEKGKTIIFCTHNVNIVPELARRVVVLNKGRITLDTDVKDAFTREDLLERAHLEVPEAAAIVNSLRKEGHDVAPSLTAQEAVRNISPLMKGGRD